MRDPAVERAFVGFGSNVGPREVALAGALAALARLPGVRLVGTSRVYETQPVGVGVGGPFLNAAAEILFRGEPEDLLGRLLGIEREAGRVRRGGRPGPRPLDLDLLLFGNRCVEAPGLRVPHPRLHERAFALRPLLDLAPELGHPVLGVPLRDLLERARDRCGLRPWPRAVPGFPGRSPERNKKHS